MEPVSNRLTCTPEDLASPVSTAEPLPGSGGADSTMPFAGPPAVAEGDDSWLESQIRDQLSGLGPDESLELSTMAGVKLNLAAEFKGKLRVDPQADGSFVVEVDGQGDGGAGAPVAGSARVGVAAGTKFHVENAAKAADLCDALLKGAAVTSANGSLPGLEAAFDLAHQLGVKGDVVDAGSRVRGYVSKISEAKVDLTGAVQVGDSIGVKFEAFGVDLKVAGAKASAQGREGLSIDFEKGELRQNLTLGVAADAFIKVPVAFNAAGNTKATVVASAVFKLPDEVKQALKEGRISGPQAWAMLAGRTLPDAVVIKAELEVSAKNQSVAAGDLKVKLKAEASLDVAHFGRTLSVDDLRQFLQQVKWSVESEAGLGGGVGADLGAAKFEVALLRKQRHQLVGKFDSGEAFQKALALARDGSDSSLVARRAASSLR
ncbi:MAG: hypothetical protein Q8L48_15680 [Archangium sp.]|nr:hypothetical protein [Archangium sp.]